MESRPNRPLRIAIVIARLNIGGPATHVIELAAGLPRDRFTVRLFAGREGRGESGMQYLAEAKGVIPETIPALSPHLGMRDISAFFQLRKVFREWSPDIVHTHTAKAGALGRVAARMAGVPTVLHTFHGHVLRGYFAPPVETLFRIIERALARATDRVITLSPALQRDLADMRIAPPEKIEVVPLGMDLESLGNAASRGNELRRELGIRGEERVIGIVGRLAPIKNHRLFLEAARSMVDSGEAARFVVVGDGVLRHSLESLVADWNLSPFVHFLGWRKEMTPVYGALDILALTSINEGTPVTVIEAMAAGIPVVATAVGGVPDTVHNGETGWLVPPGNAAALVRAWREILAHPVRTREICERARRETVHRYGRESMLRKMSELYLSAATKKANTALPVA